MGKLVIWEKGIDPEDHWPIYREHNVTKHNSENNLLQPAEKCTLTNFVN